jgi:anti-sigma factor RsiW
MWAELYKFLWQEFSYSFGIPGIMLMMSITVFLQPNDEDDE